jgi:hypothetical protein
MAQGSPFRLPAWRDGQQWTYHLDRGGRGGFEGRLTYTARRLADDAWRVEGVSDYPGDRSLHEWLEVAGEPVRMRAAVFERRNAAGLYRYEAKQAADGSLWVREQRGESEREEQHEARQGAVYLSNQLDFLLQGLDIEAGAAWRVRMRIEGGKVHPFEIRLVGREIPLVAEGETVPTTLVTVKVANNPLMRALAPPTRYWFHPRDQTILLRMEYAGTVLTLVDAS